MKKYRLSALLLSLILSVSLLPANIFANEVPDEASVGMETVPETTSYKITLPVRQEGVSVQASDSTSVAPGGSFTFFVSPAEGWKKGKNFAVKAGDQVLKPVPVKKAAKETADSKGKDPSAPGIDGSEADPGAADTAAASGEMTQKTQEKKGAAQTPEALEKTLTAKGYEKYVITNIKSDLTVTVTGLEKDPAAKPNGSDDQKKESGGSAESQQPIEGEQETSTEAEQNFPEGEQKPPAEGQESGKEDTSSEEQSGYADTSSYVNENSGDPDQPDNYAGQNVDALQNYSDADITEETDVSSINTPAYNTEGEDSEGNNNNVSDSNNNDVSEGNTSDVSEGNTSAISDSENNVVSEGGSDDVSEDENNDVSEGDDSGGSDDSESAAGYSLWIAGVQATSENHWDILGDGTVSFDVDNNILILNEADINGHGEASAPIHYKGTDTLTFDYTGSCSITDSSTVSGILSENSSVVFSGTGALTVQSAAPLSGACIQVNNGDLTISYGTVTAVSTNSGSGLYAKNISVTNDATMVQATSTKAAVTAKTKISIGNLLEISTPENGKIGTGGTTITDENGKTAANVVIEPLPVYEVSFKSGAGTGTMTSEHVAEGHQLVLPQCSFNAPQCKAFGSWKSGSSSYKAGDSVTITENTSFTAQWTDSHTLQKIAKKAATCLDSGNIEYYKCSVCGECFSDSAASKAIEESSAIIKATGHKWGSPTYTWASDNSSVTAKRVCLNDSSHTESETVRTTKTGTDPTCEKEGKYKYTAKFSNTGFVTQIKNVTTAALGHKWESYDFIWEQDDDGSWDAYCRFTCTRDSSHKKNVDADVTSTVTLPSKTADGKIVSTATAKLNDKTYTEKLEKTISRAGSSTYKFTESHDSWTLKSNKSLKFKVKRSSYDLITYKAFSHITMDGATVNSSNYKTSEGSLKLELYDDYLDKLKAGTHTLVIEFKDGSVKKSFTVKEASSKTSPSTGDDNNILLWLLSIGACGAVIAGLIAARRTMGRKRQ